MNAEMSDADRQKMMDDCLSKSGCGSSMEMGFGGGASGFGGPRPGGGEDRQPTGNFDVSLMSMEGTLQNGSIIAIFDGYGQLISLTHSYNSNMGISMLGMKMTINSSMKQEYQFTW